MKPTYDVENFRQIFEHGMTWLNGFMRNTGRFANRSALNDPDTGRRWTYSELNAEANRLANGLMRQGVEPGDIVMYMLRNSPEFVFAYLACHKIAAIGCPLNYRLAPGELALQIDDSEPRVLIIDEEFATTAAQALAMARYKPEKIIICGIKGDTPLAGEDLAEFMAVQSATNPVPAESPHIYAETTRLYTSGTTNLAKAVPINSINETLSAHDIIMQFPLNCNDRTLNMTPWFHRGGLHMGGPCPTLYAGGEVIILREFNPRRCLQIAESANATFLIGAPSVIALLARSQVHQPANLAALRGLVAMGSPLDKEACATFMKVFTPNILNGYGTTETFVNTLLRPWHLPELADRTGQACLDDDVRIVKIKEDGRPGDPDDLVAKDNAEAGEIIVFAAGKSAGSYVNNPEMTARKFYKGYHYTGDMGTWDEDEIIHVLGRKDDMVLKAGENIYPAQIEAVLNEHEKVAESAVVGVPDRRLGQSLGAYIVPGDDSLTIEELKQYCAAHPMLPVFKRPRYFRIVDSLPHTASGKILHYKLRKQACEDFKPDSAPGAHDK